MKTKTKTTQKALGLLAALLPTLIYQPSTAQAQGTAFTYQGQLANNGVPANGVYDFDFKLWDTNNAPIFQVGDVVNLGVGVTNGLFTTTLDFGAVFDRYPTLLAIYVRTNGSSSFTQLSPMQALTPVPYAITAASAGSVSAANLTGTVALGQLPAAVLTNGASGVNVSGTFAGNGAGLAGVALLASGNTFTGNQAINNGSLSVNGNINDNGSLSVNGNINASSGISSGGQIAAVGSSAALSFQCRTNPNFTWTWRDDGAGAVFGPYGSLAVSQAGNVGIWNLTPQYALDVNGNINASGGITAASFSGSGAGLTGLNAGNVSAGTLPDARLSANVALLNANQTFTGQNSFSGNVGIGTTTPTQANLVIKSETGSYSVSGNFGALASFGAAGFQNGANLVDVSLYAQGNIVALQYVAFSDERVKRIEGRSDAARDLSTLQSLEVTDYRYIDTQAKGSRPHKKLIAQQVEKVYPQAVTRTTDVVPDIYQMATVKNGWVELPTNLKVGERVRLMDARHEGITEVLEAAEGRFRTAFAADGKQVFVYGREVKDFRNVDYDAIAMLNVSATQELARRLAAREAEVAQLRAEKEALAVKVAVLETRDQARESQLARLESRLNASAPLVVRTSLERQ